MNEDYDQWSLGLVLEKAKDLSGDQLGYIQSSTLEDRHTSWCKASTSGKKLLRISICVSL